MANWNGTPNWTDFSDINGGQKFEKILSAEDLNALAENIAYLYEHQGENEYLGDYVDGNYRVGAIVKYSDGNIYICIKDTDDQQEPTNATYWELLSGKIQDEKIVDIITHGRLEFLPDEGYIAVRKFTANVAETPTFDGTINIESGYTTISGSYIIDESKAFDLLSTYGKVKTFNVNFGAGGPANGGDEIGFTSMTFDGTNGLILYNDKGAFAMNGGFDEYTANYGDGNGARVNFEEGTECRKEFKELFLSIADEYSAGETEDELAGTWTITSSPSVYISGSTTTSSERFDVNYSVDGSFYTIFARGFYGSAGGDQLYCLWGAGVSPQLAFYQQRRDYPYNTSGSIVSSTWNSGRDIVITSKLSEVTNGSALLTWLKANATKKDPAAEGPGGSEDPEPV